ncbi:MULTISPECIES: hypothetical protein [unclassified Streptomyces]|uniref:hypothetical protein n=1 Tax=unclassified Streptomyces TaxID=2593676 RepID=UPI00131BC6FE|nr:MULTISPECIES: hypothetical protein [unclassified Streptomyces]
MPHVLALQSTAGNAAASRVLGSGEARMPVQRLVKLGGKVYTNDKRHHPLLGGAESVESLWESVVQVGENGTDEERAEFETHRARMRAQLDKWVDDVAVGRLHPDPEKARTHPRGRKRQTRSYRTVEELYAGLLGWVKQKPGRHEERLLADQVRGSSDIDRHLDALLVKVKRWIDDQPEIHDMPALRNRLWQELRTSQVTRPNGETVSLGTYRQHTAQMAEKGRGEPTRIGKDMAAVLEHPEKYGQADKIVVLHDLMDYLGDVRHGKPRTAGTDLLLEPVSSRFLSTKEIDPVTGRRTESTKSRGMRTERWKGPLVTRDEADPTTLLARHHNVPVLAGQSFTTVRMLNLGAEAGGTTGELGAMAWALFAFWRINYDHTHRLANHTLHETLDMASNFGVPYNMLDRGAGLADYRPGTLLQSMRETVAALRKDLVGLGEAVKQHDRTADPDGVQLAGRYRSLREKVDTVTRGTGWMLLSDPETRAVARREASLALQDALAEYTWLCEDLARSPAVTEPAWASEPPPGTWSV